MLEHARAVKESVNLSLPNVGERFTNKKGVNKKKKAVRSKWLDEIDLEASTREIIAVEGSEPESSTSPQRKHSSQLPNPSPVRVYDSVSMDGGDYLENSTESSSPTYDREDLVSLMIVYSKNMKQQDTRTKYDKIPTPIPVGATDSVSMSGGGSDAYLVEHDISSNVEEDLSTSDGVQSNATVSPQTNRRTKDLETHNPVRNTGSVSVGGGGSDVYLAEHDISSNVEADLSTSDGVQSNSTMSPQLNRRTKDDFG